MKKILIVEDDPIVANIYRNKFLVDGFEVEIALDGTTGLNAVRAFRPDAVVLELMFSKESGVDLIKQSAPNLMAASCRSSCSQALT